MAARRRRHLNQASARHVTRSADRSVRADITAALLIVLGISSLAPPARAAEATWWAANQLEIYYDSDLKESLLDDRLDAHLNYGPFGLGVTFLSHNPSDPARLDPNDYGPQQQGIRKRWLEAATDEFRVRVGDVYSTFGRGVALRIFEDQVVDFDNALDGIHGMALVGPLEFELIAGSDTYGDPVQVLKGGRASYSPVHGWQMGLQGVWSDSLGSGGQGRPGGDRTYGAMAQGDIGSWGGVYGEYMIRNYKNFRQLGTDGPDGHAGYANLNLYLGPVQVVSEYKDLLRYDLPWVNPPTAVRQHTTTLLNRATHVANIRLDDERGGLIETYVNATDQTLLTASFSRSEARHSHQPAWELYGEVEQWLGSHHEIILRAAETEETVIEGGDEIFFERITFAGTLLLSLSHSLSLDLNVETQGGQESNRRTADYTYPLEYRNNLVSVTLNRAPNMSWAITTEWTDDPREPKDAWVWAEWNIRLGDRHQLLVGGGSIRGGQLCSGGVCKLVDPFEGGRLELLTTF